MDGPTLLVILEQMTQKWIKELDQLDSTVDRNNILTDLSDMLKQIKDTQTTELKNMNNSLGAMSNYLKDIRDSGKNTSAGTNVPIYGPPLPPGNNNSSNNSSSNPQLDLLNNNLSTLIGSMQKQATVIDEFNKEAEKKEEEGKNGPGIIDAVKGVSNAVKKASSAFSQTKAMATGAADVPFFSAIVKAMDPTIDSFRKMVRAGAGFNGSVLEMRKEATDAGMTLGQFTKAITEGGQGIRLLGPQTFSRLAKSVNDSVASMGDMGMTEDDISQNMGIFMEGLRTSGKLMTVNAQNVNMAFRDMTLQADQLATSLGITREEAMKQINKSASDPNIMFLQSLLRGRNSNPDASRNLQTLDAQFSRSPILGKLMRNVEQGLITNNPIDRDSQRLAQGLGLDTQKIQASLRSILNMNKEDARRAMASLETEIHNDIRRGSSVSNTTGSIQMLTGNNDIFGNVIGARAEAEQLGIQGQNLANAPDVPNGTKEDPLTRTLSNTAQVLQKNMVDFERANTTIMTQQAEFIRQSVRSYQTITEGLTKGMTTSMVALSTMLTPLTTALAKVLGTLNGNVILLIGAMAVVKSAMGLMSTLIKKNSADSVLDALGGGKGGKGGKGGTGRRRGIGGAIDALKDGSISRTARGAMPALKTAGKFAAHGAGLASLLYGIYDVSTSVGRWRDVNKQVADGDISQKQGKYLHAKDVSSMAGEWGVGTAGAAIGGILGGIAGSAVPGLGTAIGAGIGASLGGALAGYAGKKLGEYTVGSLYDQDTSKPKKPDDTDKKPDDSTSVATPENTPVPSLTDGTTPPSGMDSGSTINPNNPNPTSPAGAPSGTTVTPFNNPAFPNNNVLSGRDKTITDLFDQNKTASQMMYGKLDELNGSFQDLIRAIKTSGNNL